MDPRQGIRERWATWLKAGSVVAYFQHLSIVLHYFFCPGHYLKPKKKQNHYWESSHPKMALSSNVIGAINFVAMLLSIPIIGAGIWLAMEPDNSCVKILQWPVIILGILILIVALAGFVGGFWRIPWLLISYLIAMLILIILLACLVVFIYMVTVRGSGHLEPSRAYLEYRLDDFSGWLRRRVQSSYKWDRIRGCLSSTNMCAELNQSYRMAQDFFNAHISPLQVTGVFSCFHSSSPPIFTIYLCNWFRRKMPFNGIVLSMWWMRISVFLERLKLEKQNKLL